MHWQHSQVVEQVPHLDFKPSNKPFPEQVDRYNRHYHLDFERTSNGISHNIGSFKVDKFVVVAHVYQQPNAKGCVYLQHGYYDHVGLYQHVIEHCLQQGFNVFCYDLPGHGLSSGTRASIDSFQQYDAVFQAGLTLIQTHLPGPIIAMGQSTGGAVIVNYLLSRGLSRATSPFEKVYLMAPLVRPVNWFSSVLTYYLVRPFVSQVKRTFAQNSNDNGFLDFIKNNDPLQPLFLQTRWVGALKDWIKFIEKSTPVDLDIHVIQGTDDGTVDYRHNMKILQQKFSGFQVSFIEHGRHHLVNEDPNKLQQLMSFLTPLL